MPKRKRDGSVASGSSDIENEQGIRESTQTSQQSKTIHDKLHHGTVVLQRALKLARGFERQKFGRRIKTATAEKDDEKLSRLNEEKTALQELDLQAAARKCLRRHIAKEKALRTAIDVAYEFSDVERMRKLVEKNAAATANVESNLFGSNPVKEALPGVLRSLRDALRISDAVNARGVQVRKTKINSANDGDENANTPEVANEPGDNRATEHKSEHSKNRRKAAQAPLERPAEASFLPSLTMGGYLSGSDSDDEGPSEDPRAARPERKNRRGQRARQAIWEKKYGNNAKHVKDPTSKGRQSRHSGDARDRGWDMKRGAQEDNGTQRRPGFKPWLEGRDQNRHQRRSAAVSGGNATTVVPRKPAGTNGVEKEKPLHPSWEAAKKAKLEKPMPSFAGTKVVFG